MRGADTVSDLNKAETQVEAKFKTKSKLKTEETIDISICTCIQMYYPKVKCESSPASRTEMKYIIESPVFFYVL